MDDFRFVGFGGLVVVGIGFVLVTVGFEGDCVVVGEMAAGAFMVGVSTTVGVVAMMVVDGSDMRVVVTVVSIVDRVVAEDGYFSNAIISSAVRGFIVVDVVVMNIVSS